MRDAEVFVGGLSRGATAYTLPLDTAAALRAMEVNAEVLLKATKVDGVYTADPMKDPDARRYEHLTFDEAIEQKLAVMDTTALVLCRDHHLPVRVFNLHEPGNLKRVVEGEAVGTLVNRD